jgi:hypothetical protein
MGSILIRILEVKNLWIRIWNTGYQVPLTNGSGCGSVPKSSLNSRMQKTFIYFFICFNNEILKLQNCKNIFDDKIEFFARKLLYLNFILQPFFRSAQHSYEKREGSVSVLVANGSVPYAVPGDPNPFGCGSGTLDVRYNMYWISAIITFSSIRAIASFQKDFHYQRRLSREIFRHSRFLCHNKLFQEGFCKFF